MIGPTEKGDGKTPLSPDEVHDLIPSLATKEELNEFERENILHARLWALDQSRSTTAEILTDDFIRKLHREMFGATWKWAGTYRKSEKNIGVPVYQMRERLAALLGDVRYWIEHETYSPDEIALRLHHQLVYIHLFPNGNGRHARLLADLLAVRLGQKPFSWGAKELVKAGEARARYLEAVRKADAGDYAPLITFSRA